MLLSSRLDACSSASLAHCLPPAELSIPRPLPKLNPLLVCCLPCRASVAPAQFLGACTKQKPYIVITELMACSLADAFLKTFYAPTQRRQVEIALDFAKGMAYLHSRRQPIVHRWAHTVTLSRARSFGSDVHNSVLLCILDVASGGMHSLLSVAQARRPG